MQLFFTHKKTWTWSRLMTLGSGIEAQALEGFWVSMADMVAASIMQPATARNPMGLMWRKRYPFAASGHLLSPLSQL